MAFTFNMYIQSQENMKKYLFCLLACLFVSLVLLSCEENDENDNPRTEVAAGTGTFSDNQSGVVSSLSGAYRGKYALSMQFLGETLREPTSEDNTVCL